ncbi:MAG: hypothetical protein QOE53_869 [Pseudonocardiales bacterium]|nr:hypothetical protein [Pseudonocardiales bacterium]
MADELCEACGQHNIAGTRFCTSCGSYLSWDGSTRTFSGDDGDGQRRSEREDPTPRRVLDTTGSTELSPIVHASTPSAVAPPVGSCPRCAMVNPPERRFCGKCALPLDGRPDASVGTPRRSGRQASGPLISPRGAAERAARAAYRRSLPLRYRLTRVGVGVGVVALIAALIAVTRHDPLAWSQHRLDDLRNTLVPVDDVTASADPPGSVAEDYSAAGVVDGHLETAWAVAFTSAGSADLSCGTAVGGAALLLSAPEPVRVRALSVRAGLGTLDPSARLHQWRPKTLELRSAGNWCERVRLQDTADPQLIRLLHPVSTRTLRVTVVGGYPPQGGKEQLTAITEIALLARPT